MSTATRRPIIPRGKSTPAIASWRISKEKGCNFIAFADVFDTIVTHLRSHADLFKLRIGEIGELEHAREFFEDAFFQMEHHSASQQRVINFTV